MVQIAYLQCLDVVPHCNFPNVNFNSVDIRKIESGSLLYDYLNWHFMLPQDNITLEALQKVAEQAKSPIYKNVTLDILTRQTGINDLMNMIPNSELRNRIQQYFEEEFQPIMEVLPDLDVHLDNMIRIANEVGEIPYDDPEFKQEHIYVYQSTLLVGILDG